MVNIAKYYNVFNYSHLVCERPVHTYCHFMVLENDLSVVLFVYSTTLLGVELADPQLVENVITFLMLRIFKSCPISWFILHLPRNIACLIRILILDCELASLERKTSSLHRLQWCLDQIRFCYSML